LGNRPDTEENANHPWKGLSLFKKGFGGHEKDYLRTKDYPLNFNILARLFI
jgi:lipid II:glycine glycyltransferase (peptidoglycan interpeptide bridge formation enzyme)